jgi:hypothetical protein
MSTNSNEVQTKAKPVTGTVSTGGGVGDLIRPSSMAARNKAVSETASELRSAVAKWDTSTANIVTLMAKVILFGTTTDAGDALDILFSKDKALAPAKSQVSKAKAAAYAAEKFGVTSTASREWQTILHAARAVGVGRSGFEQALKGKRPQSLAKVLREISEPKGADRDAAIRKAFKSSRTTTPDTGSKAWRKAEAALNVVRDVNKWHADSDGLTATERKTLSALISALAISVKDDRPAKPAAK